MAQRGKDLRQEIVLPGTPDDLVEVVERPIRWAKAWLGS
jgi:hypothetical protein